MTDIAKIWSLSRYYSRSLGSSHLLTVRKDSVSSFTKLPRCHYDCQAYADIIPAIVLWNEQAARALKKASRRKCINRDLFFSRGHSRIHIIIPLCKRKPLWLAKVNYAWRLSIVNAHFSCFYYLNTPLRYRALNSASDARTCAPSALIQRCFYQIYIRFALFLRNECLREHFRGAIIKYYITLVFI